MSGLPLKMDQNRLAEELRKQAQMMIEDVSVLEEEVEEFDFKEAFARILAKEDWTDKVVRGIGRVRGMFHRPQRDTQLPDEFRSLVPDMKQVAVAYAELTEGYKDFIRAVRDAQVQRQNTHGKRLSNVGDRGLSRK